MNFSLRKYTVFILCVLLSTFFWILNKLSKEYTTNIIFPVEYIYSSSDLILTTSLPENLIVKVNGFGFDLLRIKLFKRKNVFIDINNLLLDHNSTSSFDWLTEVNNDLLVTQISEDIIIESIEPSKISFNFEPRVEKKIPIKANYLFKETEYFQILKDPIIDPEFITISGSQYELDTIEFWITELENLGTLKTNFKTEVGLLKPTIKSSVKLKQEKCIIEFLVSEFTEKNIELLVDLLNVPFGYTAMIFPSRINAKFTITIDDFNSITKDDFTVLYDFENKVPLSKSLISLTILSSSTKIKNLKIYPETVEYLLIKQ